MVPSITFFERFQHVLARQAYGIALGGVDVGCDLAIGQVRFRLEQTLSRTEVHGERTGMHSPISNRLQTS